MHAALRASQKCFHGPLKSASVGPWFERNLGVYSTTHAAAMGSLAAMEALSIRDRNQQLPWNSQAAVLI